MMTLEQQIAAIQEEIEINEVAMEQAKAKLTTLKAKLSKLQKEKARRDKFDTDVKNSVPGYTQLPGR